MNFKYTLINISKMQIESIKDEGRGITIVISNDNKIFDPNTGVQIYTNNPKDFYQIFIPGATIIPIQNPNPPQPPDQIYQHHQQQHQQQASQRLPVFQNPQQIQQGGGGLPPGLMRSLQ